MRILLIGTIFVAYQVLFIRKNLLPRVEYFHILVMITTLTLLVQSNHFVMFFAVLNFNCRFLLLIATHVIVQLH